MSDITEHIGRLLYEITVLLIALVGMSCNLLGIVFLFHNKVKHSFHVFLTSLMVSDVFFLSFALLQCSSTILLHFDLGSVSTAIYPAALLLKGIQFALYNFSVFIIACMSLERLSSVCFPLSLSKRINRKCALFFILVGIMLNITVLIPVLVQSETPKNSANTTFIPTVFQWRVGEESLPKREIYITIVITITRLLPAAVAFIANVYLIIVLIRRRPRRAFLFANRISRNDRRRFDDFGTTLTLILISIFVLLSLVPAVIVQVLVNLYPNTYLIENKAEYRYYTTTLAFGRFVSVLSAANDFVVYILMSKRSRLTLKHVLREKICKCFRRRRASSSQRSRMNFGDIRI